MTGGGITSDTARREIEELMRSAHTKEQVKEVVAFAKREMNNREASYVQQVNDIKNRMREPSAQKAEPATGPKEGDKSKSKSGKDIIFKGGRWEYL